MASDELQGASEAPTPRLTQGPIRALSVDPGGTSGYAICDIESSDKITLGWDQAKLTESQLMDLLLEYNPYYIICEDFEYRNKPRPKLDLTPVKLIGVVKLYCDKYYTHLEMQKAATGKAFWTDRKLKQFGLYERGRQHGRDAERHMLHWLTFKQGFSYIGKDLQPYMIKTIPVELFGSLNE